MRLTDHLEKDSVFTCDEKTFIKCYKKLSQLEDIEEEFGIDLITLFKALKNGTYTKDYYDYKNPRRTELVCDDKQEWWIRWLCLGGQYEYFKVKDYGKTWALTKKELKESCRLKK